MNKNRKVCGQNQATGVTPKFLVIPGSLWALELSRQQHFQARAQHKSFKDAFKDLPGAMLTKWLMHSLI